LIFEIENEIGTKKASFKKTALYSSIPTRLGPIHTYVFTSDVHTYCTKMCGFLLYVRTKLTTTSTARILYRQTDRQTDRQTNTKQTDRQTNTNRQTDDRSIEYSSLFHATPMPTTTSEKRMSSVTTIDSLFLQEFEDIR